MIGGAAEALFRYGRIFTAKDADGENERSFLGFMDCISPEGERANLQTKAGTVPRERFRLIAEPGESFSNGLSTRVFCGETEYKLLSLREIYAGGELSYRECVLRKAGGNA